jgi:MFS family permease
VDVSPLRASRDFRRLWLGLLASTLGSQFTIVASFVQVFDLTRSSAAVGLVGLVGFLGLAVGTLVGSTFLDAFDRRKILIAAQVGYLVSSGTLLAGALLGDPPIGLIYAAVAGIAATSAIDSPTRSAMTPRLLDRSQLPAAAALNQLTWNGAGLIGPALAGVVVAGLGFAGAYAIDLASIGLLLLASISIRPMPPARSERASIGWRAVREGFSFLRGRRLLQSTFVIDIIAMVFGMPRALFPVLALRQFGGGTAVAGLLFAAPAVGAFIGAGITAFGVVGSNLWLGLFFLAVAGAADVISAVFRNTILQVTVPEDLRGRLFAIHILVVAGGPRLGDLEAGLVASAFTPTVSIVSGGLLCIVGAGLLAWLVPSLRRYRASEAA